MQNTLATRYTESAQTQFADHNSMKSPHVVVLIINNNRNDDTIECLASVAKSTYLNCRVIVLDIAPSGQIGLSLEAHPPNVQVMSLEENRGYTGNNNLGFRLALEHKADFVFLLNNDAIIAPDCIEHLVKSILADSTVGMTGPLIYHYDEPNTMQTAGGVLDGFWAAKHLGRNEIDTGQFSMARPVDWLSGCALMVRRDVLERLGGFDERFFMYWEEVDWCLRAHQQGWTLLHVPQAKVWHKGAQRHYQPEPRVTYYSVRNQFLFLREHQAPLPVRLYRWAETIRTLVSWTVRPKWRHMRLHRNAMWQAICDVLLNHWGMRES